MLDALYLLCVSWTSQTYDLVANINLSDFQFSLIQIFLLLISFFSLYPHCVYIPSFADVPQFGDSLF